MRRLLILIPLLAGASAWSNPPASNDDMGAFLAEKGILGQIQQLTHSVGHRAADLASHAIGFLGVPYRLGGSNMESGFDCSGFVRAIVEQTYGLMLPRMAEQQAAATVQIDQAQLQPGDLVFFNTLQRAFSHVGIYMGQGRFIHSPKPGAQVRLEDMTKTYWVSRFNGARRVAALQSATSATP